MEQIEKKYLETFAKEYLKEFNKEYLKSTKKNLSAVEEEDKGWLDEMERYINKNRGRIAADSCAKEMERMFGNGSGNADIA